ncbi:MAG: hypothetical protein ACP5JJ_14075, partial [Anaerolineae bacterium]
MYNGSALGAPDIAGNLHTVVAHHPKRGLVSVLRAAQAYRDIETLAGVPMQMDVQPDLEIQVAVAK